MNVRVVVSLRSLALSHSFLAHIAWLKAQDVRVFVSSHPCMKRAFPLTSLISSSPSSSFSHSSSSSSSSCFPSTSPRLSSKIPCATSPKRWGQLTSPSPTQTQEEESRRKAQEVDNEVNLSWTGVCQTIAKTIVEVLGDKRSLGSKYHRIEGPSSVSK